ncbi:MAG: thermonuclease family protein [Actinobacteria bacterium]|nr:MAG: thermonuclease family protein [Actinomycetota bacterium]
MTRRPGLGAIALLVIVALVVARVWVGGGGSGSEEGGTAGQAVSAQVIRVIDGDTIEVSIGGQDEDVRYIGVDTPETVKPDTPVQCYGPQASAENHRLVDGRTVRLVFDRERRDVYGRLLAYVYTTVNGGGAGQSRFVNATLVRDGYARTLTIPPNTAHVSQLGRLQARAGRAGRGLWGVC